MTPDVPDYPCSATLALWRLHAAGPAPVFQLSQPVP